MHIEFRDLSLVAFLLRDLVSATDHVTNASDTVTPTTCHLLSPSAKCNIMAGNGDYKL